LVHSFFLVIVGTNQTMTDFAPEDLDLVEKIGRRKRTVEGQTDFSTKTKGKDKKFHQIKLKTNSSLYH
jgi:hypothetical protein